MSEITVSLKKAKREDVTGTEMAGRKTKIEHWTGTERLFPASKYLHLAHAYPPPAVLLDNVSTVHFLCRRKEVPPQGLPLVNDSVAHGLGLSHPA